MAGRFFAILISMVLAASIAEASRPGIPVAQSFVIAKEDSREFKEIRGLFNSLAEEAKRGNVLGIVSMYSGHLEPRKDVKTLHKRWKDLFSMYSNLEIFYPIYNIEVKGDLARVKCERIITGMPRNKEESTGHVLIEVRRPLLYNLIRENGAWKIIGGQYPYPELPPSLVIGKEY